MTSGTVAQRRAVPGGADGPPPPAPAGPLRRLRVPETRSRILAATGGHVWAFSLPQGRGLFSKDDAESHRRGRRICDAIIERYGCGGFFTTDELPRYGLGRRDRARLLADYGADDVSDVLVLLAYDDRRMVAAMREDILTELESGPPAG